MTLSETTHRVVPIGEPETPARKLAYNRTFRSGRSLSLLPRLKEAEQAIGKANHDPWLFGNRRLLEDTFEGLRRSLPAFGKASLPLSADGALLGFPRIFEIAVELVAANSSDLSPDSIQPFIEEYQSVHALDMGELWALDTMLAVAILEALARSSDDKTPALIASLKTVQSASWREFFRTK